jgi:hypothetical protein
MKKFGARHICPTAMKSHRRLDNGGRKRHWATKRGRRPKNAIPAYHRYLGGLAVDEPDYQGNDTAMWKIGLLEFVAYRRERHRVH